MIPNTRKYYVLIPAAFRYSGESCWKELCAVKSIISKAKTLTSAQRYVDRVFGGLPAPKIDASINGARVKVIIRPLSEPTAQANMASVVLTAQKYGCASRYNLGSLRFLKKSIEIIL